MSMAKWVLSRLPITKAESFSPCVGPATHARSTAIRPATNLHLFSRSLPQSGHTPSTCYSTRLIVYPSSSTVHTSEPTAANGPGTSFTTPEDCHLRPGHNHSPVSLRGSYFAPSG